MKRLNWLAPVLVAAAVLVPNVSATTVKVLGAGSSAQYKTTAIGAFLNLAGGVGHGHHYTIKGTTSGGNNFGQIHDSRNNTISNQGGNVWIVWDSTMSNVWAYLSVDSVVGNRAYFAQPRAQFQLDPSVQTTPGQNLIAATLFGGQADEAAVPAAIYTALNNTPFNAAFTDIRPEDAHFAQCRAASSLDPVNYTGLGYGTTAVPNCGTAPTLVGTPIVSAVSSPPTNAQPVAFSIFGNDPFTGLPVPAYTTIPIGAAPIIFIINREDPAGLGAGLPGAPVFTNMTLASIQRLYQGLECDTNAFGATGAPPNVPVTVFNREPLSGTFNTMEFTNIRLTPNMHKKTQEFNVNPSTMNPLNNACNTVAGIHGTRKRSIGTGEVGKGLVATQDSIGYMFFSFANIQPLSGTTNFGYMTVQGIDPIQTSYTNGVLPTCAEPCPVTPGNSFPNLRNGTYRTWSVLRVATDSAPSVSFSNVHALVLAAQSHVNETDPDFVPFLPQADGDPGLQKYRSHFTQSGFSPNNGLPNGSGTEHGGDMGGCIEPNGPPPGVVGCRQ